MKVCHLCGPLSQCELMENVSKKEDLCPWPFLHVGVYLYFRSVDLCFQSCSLGLIPEEGISGQSVSCSADHLFWRQVPHLAQGTFVKCCSLIRFALDLLQFQSHAAMLPKNYSSSWMWNSINSASVSGTWIQDATSELHCHSPKNMLFVVLLAPVMGVQSSLLLWIILPNTYMCVWAGKKTFWNQHFQL